MAEQLQPSLAAMASEAELEEGALLAQPDSAAPVLQPLTWLCRSIGAVPWLGWGRSWRYWVPAVRQPCAGVEVKSY